MHYAQELRTAALRCLLETDPHAKTRGVAALARSFADGAVTLDSAAALADSEAIPGRPARPELVPPRLVGRRSMASVEGRAMLVHALAHIEFNAMNLALTPCGVSPACRTPITPTGCRSRRKRPTTSRCWPTT
jgi:uncharacterized ferritin-like protein (DUF455 family)